MEHSLPAKPGEMYPMDHPDCPEDSAGGAWALVQCPGESFLRPAYLFGWWECAITCKELKPVAWSPMPDIPKNYENYTTATAERGAGLGRHPEDNDP